MTKAGKVWGETRLLLNNPFVEFHHLTIQPHARCSLHLHRFKANAFFIFSGRMYVETVKNDYPLTDVTELGPGDFMVVAPNERHRFVTKDEPCEAVEFYFPQANGDDIVRDDVGGKDRVTDDWVKCQECGAELKRTDDGTVNPLAKIFIADAQSKQMRCLGKDTQPPGCVLGK